MCKNVHSFIEMAAVLVKLQKEVDQDASNTRVVGAKTTKTRDFLIITGSSSNIIFENEVTPVFGVLGKLQKVDRRVTLGFRDLD